MEFRPVFRIGEIGEWHRLSTPATTEIGSIKRKLLTSFDFEFTGNETTPVYFAFCYPYTYTDLQKDLIKYEEKAKEVPYLYYKRELMIRSAEGRNIDLITISSKSRMQKKDEEDVEGIFQECVGKRAARFDDSKKIVFITARVHPGESPASFGLQGVFDLLLDRSDPVAIALRNMFVFKIVPMINPDGVARGHFRMDSFGVNLNRYYDDPSPIKQPSVYAIKQLLNQYNSQNRVFFFCDFHGHGNTKNCFFYGNCLNFVMQVESRTFAKLLAMNSPDFNYSDCNFSKKHMGKSGVDRKKDKKTKEGSARVSTYRDCNLIHSYTLEFGYHQNKGTSDNPPKEFYKKSNYKQLGRCLLVTLLDLFRKEVSPNISSSEYGNIEGVRKQIAETIKKNYHKTENKLNIKVMNIHQLIEELHYKEIKDSMRSKPVRKYQPQEEQQLQPSQGERPKVAPDSPDKSESQKPKDRDSRVISKTVRKSSKGKTCIEERARVLQATLEDEEEKPLTIQNLTGNIDFGQSRVVTQSRNIFKKYKGKFPRINKYPCIPMTTKAVADLFKSTNLKNCGIALVKSQHFGGRIGRCDQSKKNYHKKELIRLESSMLIESKTSTYKTRKNRDNSRHFKDTIDGLGFQLLGNLKTVGKDQGQRILKLKLKPVQLQEIGG